MNVVLRKARFVQMLLFFVLVTSLTSCASSHQFSGSVLENPVPAYAFEGTNYTGDPFRLSDHHGKVDRKSTRLNSSHIQKSRMPSSA